MSGITKMVEYIEHSDELKMAEGYPQLYHLVVKKALALAAEEKSKPAPCEPDGYEKWLESEIGNDVYEKGYRTFLLRARAMYRASKPVPVEAIEGLTEYDKGEMALDQHLAPVEAKATAEGSLVALCWELLEMAENPDAIVARATEDSEAVYKSECFDFEKARQTLSRYRPASPAVEELVRELRELIDGPSKSFNTEWITAIESIIRKYDNAKGGK